MPKERYVRFNRILLPRGIFRSSLPDLEWHVRRYVNSSAPDAADKLIAGTEMGVMTRPRGVVGLIKAALGNSRHRWMWDYNSLAHELQKCGFTSIRRAKFGDSDDPEFSTVEVENRWDGCLGFECRKAG
jgi:hypothetical protein